MARLIWRIIHITFGLQKTNNVIHMLGSWLQGIGGEEKKLNTYMRKCCLLGMWLSRNDIIFKK